MGWNVLISILIALLLTELTEYLVLLLWLDDKRAVPTVLICNLITNPVANGIMIALGSFCTNIAILIVAMLTIEGLTVLVEYFIISAKLKYPAKKCLKYSLVLNLSSFLFGIAMTFLT